MTTTMNKNKAAAAAEAGRRGRNDDNDGIMIALPLPPRPPASPPRQQWQRQLRLGRRNRNRQLLDAVAIDHDKEASELDVASGGDGTAPLDYVVEATTTTTTTTTSTAATEVVVVVVAEDEDEDDAHEQDPHQSPQISKEEYEASFPSEPESPRAATTFSLFSDPNRFSPTSIASSTHYVTHRLHGALWLDADADGTRGSASDPTLNAMEYDRGIGGVEVQLVKCDKDDESPVFAKTSKPNAGFGEGSSVRRSDDPEGGLYNFELERVEPGRYYVMYRAPKNYRVNGNVLPLGRTITDDGAYFTCVPSGGEGDEYLERVAEEGDLDWEGYCARTVGCLEVGRMEDLVATYGEDNLVPLLEEGADDVAGEETDAGVVANNNNNLFVALPSEHLLNVGLAEEEWPLSTYQFADSEITLSFPVNVTENGDDGEEFERAAVPGDFDKSEVKRNLEAALAKFYAGDGSSGAFQIQGVELHGGEIIHRKKSSSGQEEEEEGEGGKGPSSRMRGMLRRGLQASKEKVDLSQAGAEAEVEGEGEAVIEAEGGDDGDGVAPAAAAVQVKYTLTTRGAYNPPPHEQLGAILEDSVNRDPGGLVKSIKERRGEGLPPVFEDVEDVDASHLTVQIPQKGKVPAISVAERQEISNAKAAEESRGRMADWATVPVILLAFLIAALMGMLLFRRVFVRRKRGVKRDHVGIYLKEGHTGSFTVSKFNQYDDLKDGKVPIGGDDDDDDEDNSGGGYDRSMDAHPLAPHPEEEEEEEGNSIESSDDDDDDGGSPRESERERRRSERRRQEQRRSSRSSSNYNNGGGGGSGGEGLASVEQAFPRNGANHQGGSAMGRSVSTQGSKSSRGTTASSSSGREEEEGRGGNGGDPEERRRTRRRRHSEQQQRPEGNGRSGGSGRRSTGGVGMGGDPDASGRSRTSKGSRRKSTRRDNRSDSRRPHNEE